LGQKLGHTRDRPIFIVITSYSAGSGFRTSRVARPPIAEAAMDDPAKDFQAAFIVANLDPIRALPILRVPGAGRDPDLKERQLHARDRVHKALEALGGISSPAGSCVWHVVGLQCSVREWAIRQGWGRAAGAAGAGSRDPGGGVGGTR